MEEVGIIKQLGDSFFSYSILCVAVHFLAKILIPKSSDFKFANPKKDAFFAILAITISSSMISGLMLLVKSLDSSQATTSIQIYNLNGVISTAITFLIILSPILITKRVRKESWESIGVSKHNLKASILIGAALAILCIIQVILFSTKSLSEIRQSINMSALWAFLNFTIVGFSEEFMFRGYLQTRLIGLIGRWKGWVLTSVTMALIHIPQRIVSMGLSPNEAILSSILLIPISLTMGYIMIKTKNIMAVGIYHTFANWVNIFM